MGSLHLNQSSFMLLHVKSIDSICSSHLSNSGKPYSWMSYVSAPPPEVWRPWRIAAAISVAACGPAATCRPAARGGPGRNRHGTKSRPRSPSATGVKLLGWKRGMAWCHRSGDFECRFQPYTLEIIISQSLFC